ncbi:MAG: 3-deoxy-7-phosphoheptulonate synthase [Flavobacteriaceae bacterium]|nr:3-deoxy-7-phosphoheptulonate synthase [Flavobacteriaceae bacterium]
MIIILNQDITPYEFDQLADKLQSNRLGFHRSNLGGKQILTIPNAPSGFDIRQLQMLDGVQEAIEINEPYKLASKRWKKEQTAFEVQGVEIGGNAVNIVAGPCAVEDEEQIFAVAECLYKNNIKFIRGGAYKPRTSPYAFQGLKTEGLKLLRNAADAFKLRVVTEVMDLSLLDEVYQYADIIQIGTRNMSNFYFLSELGKIDKPILLKRGMAAKIPEWLMAAEYILSGGNEKVILCERGICTFDDSVRNTLDVAAFPIIKELSHLPVWSDPSHGTGIRNRVAPLALASIAAGADGLILEMHPNPEVALSDGPQSLYPHQLEELVSQLKPIAKVVGRHLDCELIGHLV